MKRLTITGWIHQWIAGAVAEDSLCIDATAGKGRDTLFLAGLAGQSGKILAFDIQAEAVAETQKLLAENGLSENTRVILDSHANMGAYAGAESVDVIMFNFGYLPGGDHALSTQPETSVKAIQESLRLLKSGGLLSLCIYSGGDTGFDEKEQILKFLGTLDDKCYMVMMTTFPNRTNHPPIPVLVHKY